jgi:MATE family multidrug resistance protein
MQNPSIKYILKLSITIFVNLAIPLVEIIGTGLMGDHGNLLYGK